MIHGKKVLAFIPAKTGSVGLPGKLFKKIGGYSLLEWTLLAAYKSHCIDEIVVSSNDPLVEKAVEDFLCETVIASGIEVNDKRVKFVQRPDSLCTPISKTEDAISHFFETYTPYTRDYDYLVMLQVTSPARRNMLIDNCIRNLGNSFDEYDSLITVEKTTPFFWRVNQEIGMNYPEYSLRDRPMRQELKEEDFYYKDSGNVYITKVGEFLQSHLRVSGRTQLYQTDKFESLQIDDIEDFVMMESLYNHYGSFL